jgi:hypothetical protein
MHDEPSGGNSARASKSVDPEAANPRARMARQTAGGADDGEDDEATARRGIEYLAFHDPIICVSFNPDDPPSEAILRLLSPHLVGIEKEISHLLSRYLMERLAPHLRLGGIEIP